MFDENVCCPLCGSKSLKQLNNFEFKCLSCANQFQIEKNSDNEEIEPLIDKRGFLFFRRRETKPEVFNSNPYDFIVNNGVLIKYDGKDSYVKIPDEITAIGDNAFANCGYLTKVIIGPNVSKISETAFANCCNLNNIIVDLTNPYYDSRENCNAIIETKNDVLVTGCAKTIIPESLLSIGNYAFSGRVSMTSIIIPKNILSIGYEAFSSCCNLADIFYNGTKKDWSYIQFKSKYSDPTEYAQLHCSNKY